MAQISSALTTVASRDRSILLTHLDIEKHAALDPTHRDDIDYDPVSRTGFFQHVEQELVPRQVAVVAAGTSDSGPACEAIRTLQFNGIGATVVFDVGVAGLWRLLKRVEDLRCHPIIIAVAGMDAALPTVLGGLVPGCLIAVPTSTGYGTARQGDTALNACLTSCSAGITVCNIDNGFGAAHAALRILNAMREIRTSN